MSEFLKCPKCGEAGLRCADSRPTDEATKIRRRRVCDECEHRFSTIEILLDDYNRYLNAQKMEKRLRALCRNTITEIDRWQHDDDGEPHVNGQAEVRP